LPFLSEVYAILPNIWLHRFGKMLYCLFELPTFSIFLEKIIKIAVCVIYIARINLPVIIRAGTIQSAADTIRIRYDTHIHDLNASRLLNSRLDSGISFIFREKMIH